MNRLIIVGSPREKGRSAALAEQLFEACIEEHPDEEVTLAPVATLYLEPCTGCNACRKPVEQAKEVKEYISRCPTIDDDMIEIYELLDAADELIVVSPVYFAGPPAQLKALLDRFQPYYWSGDRGGSKRPATLHIVGEGGDPHGFEPLVGTVRSALSVAGFELDRILDWVGKLDEEGEIVSEARIVRDESLKASSTSQKQQPKQHSQQPASQQNKQRPELHIGTTPGNTPKKQGTNPKRKGGAKGSAKGSAKGGTHNSTKGGHKHE